MDEKIVLDIVELEWEMFSDVNNMGGKASCQEDFMTFKIMIAGFGGQGDEQRSDGRGLLRDAGRIWSAGLHSGCQPVIDELQCGEDYNSDEDRPDHCRSPPDHRVIHRFVHTWGRMTAV